MLTAQPFWLSSRLIFFSIIAVFLAACSSERTASPASPKTALIVAPVTPDGSDAFTAAPPPRFIPLSATNANANAPAADAAMHPLPRAPACPDCEH
jgi:hypothetical protein